MSIKSKIKLCNQIIDEHPSITVGEYYRLVGPNNNVIPKALYELRVKYFLQTLPSI